MQAGKPFNPKEFGRQLGFDVKYEASEFLETATFLKGWWQRDGTGEVQWVPLPSAVIKLGKVLRDPVEITKFTRKGKKMHRTPLEAVRMCALALASSYGKIDLSYPILGAFCAVLERCGQYVEGNFELQESWKPRMSGIAVDRDSVLNSIHVRYGIEVEDVLRVERLLGRIHELPAYVEDEVFDKLCSRDY